MSYETNRDFPVTPAQKQVTWILVCDSGKARLFFNHGARDGVHEMQDITHPIPKTTELMTGKRGRNKPGDGFLMRHAYEPPTSPRDKEKRDFVKQIAQMINKREAEFSQLIIAAPPLALHVLRKELSPHVKEKMIGEIDKDLTGENESSLPQFLKPFMPVYDPLHDYTQTRAGQFGAS